MQFQVPQFIETEDKIVGPLTLRQFLYLAAGGALSVILYFTVQLWLWAAATFLLAAVAAALAFIKINGQPLIKILTAALAFYFKPQMYVWQPERPELKKTESTLKSMFGEGLSLENIIAGLSLKRAQEQVLTGTKTTSEKAKRLFSETKEHYEIFQKLSGERRAARRVDYR